MRQIRGAVGIALVGGVLAGCANSDELKSRITGRWGPDPALPSSDVSNVIQNQNRVLYYILCYSGSVPSCADGVNVTPPAPGSPVWYDVVEWGFNVGRQDCEVYLGNLFRMNREKGRNDNILAAMSTAAALIVTGTTSAQKPLSILAAAFGLSIAVNDAIFESYLFSQAPGLVAKKVKDLQDTYRDAIAKDHSQIVTGADAYNAIQNYYHICLPHAIEGVLLEKIADSNPATPVTPPTTTTQSKTKKTGVTAPTRPLNKPPSLM